LSARRIRLLLLGPASAFYTLFFVAPLAILAIYSISTQIDFRVEPALSLDSYATVMSSDLYRAVFIRTVLVGLVTASIVVPVAYMLAYAMRFVFPRHAHILLDVILISMFSGYLVRIYSWRTILGKDGLLNTALLQVGLIREPITFLIFSNWAIVITLVGLILPLAVLPIASSMANISREHLEVARDLGSRGLRLHRTIVIPMALPGISTAFAIAFILAAGDFVVPAMLGGTQGVMVGNLIADQFKGIAPNWPLGAALALAILAVVVAIQVTSMRVVRFVTRW
jgi:spermidine/putrescine transport system permease protein